MNLMVNQLPSRTWNRLKMNETYVQVEEALENLTPGADYDPSEISWNPDYREDGGKVRGELAPLMGKALHGFAHTEAFTKMEKPLVLSYDYENGQKAASYLSLYAEEGSHMKVVVLLRSQAEAEATSALQISVDACGDAVVDLYLLDLLGSGARCFNHVEGLAHLRDQIHLIRLDLGGREIYSGVSVNLRGNESRFCSETGYHVKTGQVLDMNYVAVHTGKRTEADMVVNGTLEEGARKVFRGTIDFRQGCAGARAAENENVMLMGEELVNQTIPVILCKEEDVEGSHGASIGQLDDKVLFYLGSRGISREAAQAMIAQARIDAICEKIPLESVRNQVREFEEIRGISHGEEL